MDGVGGTGGMGGAGGAGGAGGGSGGTAGGGGSVETCNDCSFGRRYGDDEEQGTAAFAVGDDGSVFISGSYNGSMFLGPNVGVVDGNGTEKQAFLAKLDRTGNPQWIVNPSGSASVGGEGSGVAVSNGIVAWGGSTGNDPVLRDMFVETRNLAGDSTIIAKTKLGSQWHDDLTGLALSSDGKTVYVAGVLHGSALTYGGCPQLGAYDAGGNPNLVVFALDAMTLSCKWGKTWTGGNHNPGTIRIAVAADGHPVVTGGYTSGTLSGTGLPTPSGAFVLKLDAANGNLLGAKGFANALPLAMTVDASTNRIVIAGGVTGALTFAGEPYPAPIAPDTTHIMVLAYDGALDEKWGQVLAGPTDQYCQGLSTDGAGRLYVGCIHTGSLTLPNGPSANCTPNTICGLLVTLASTDGTVMGDKSGLFGAGQPIEPGCLFLTAASSKALVLGATWTVPMTLLDGTPLNPIGEAKDYDVLVSKVEPLP